MPIFWVMTTRSGVSNGVRAARYWCKLTLLGVIMSDYTDKCRTCFCRIVCKENVSTDDFACQIAHEALDAARLGWEQITMAHAPIEGAERDKERK